MNLFDRWRSLPAARRRLIRQAALAVPLATTLLWSLGADRARRVLVRVPWRLRRSDPVAELGWSVEAVGRRLPGAKCLARAVAAAAILERWGRDPELHSGARRSLNGRVGAHAWVEAEGRVVVGAHERDAFTRLEPPAEGGA
jgi:hypothetical protein